MKGSSVATSTRVLDCNPEVSESKLSHQLEGSGVQSAVSSRQSSLKELNPEWLIRNILNDLFYRLLDDSNAGSQVWVGIAVAKPGKHQYLVKY